MKIKVRLVGALAITVVLGIASLGIVNADELSSAQPTTPSTIECPQDGSGIGAQDGVCSRGPKDGTGIGAKTKSRGCRQNRQGKRSRQGENSNFMASIEDLQQGGILSEEDIKNIQEYHANNREHRQNRSYNSSCTKIDEMISKNIITSEQGRKLKETLKNNLNI